MSMHKIQQVIKWTVYTLLIINFFYYVFEDWNRALHTLTASSTLLDWTAEFANSIDESAWFFLLIMFELETYVLEDETWTGWVAHAVRGVRVVCYAMLAHTVYAYVLTVMSMQPTVAVDDVSSLCDMTDADISYVYNLEYTDVSTETCANISTATEYFWVAGDPIVSSLEGLQLERDLAWADLAEAIFWLIIIAAIELVVRLQSRGITDGPVIVNANRIKYLLYTSLILIGVYWAWLGHWLYFWDELVWIGGFAAIEMNMNEWRDEIAEDKGVAA
jgi:hypothetical protein